MSQADFTFPKPLIDKYAPTKIEDFVGLTKVKLVIQNFLRRPVECPWLFWGASGLGKSQMAMAMTAALDAQWHHIPAAHCDIEAIDSICRGCYYAPFNFDTGRPSLWHLVQVDEIDRATPTAQLGLLSKTDRTAYPPQTIFVFTSNNLSLETRFLSRCRVLKFDTDDMKVDLPKFLARVATAEMCPLDIDFVKLARDANYNVRDALNKLELELLGGEYLTDRIVKAVELEEDRAEILRNRFDVKELGDGWIVSCRQCNGAWPCSLPIKEKSFTWLMNHFAAETRPQ